MEKQVYSSVEITLEGNDTLEGGDGNDILDSGIGSDSVVGGSGSDHLVFDRSSEKADVTIIYTDSNVDGTITGGVNDGTTFREIESVDELRLGSGNDNLNFSGTTADQQDIYSGEGNDTVVGGSSRDRIRGEDGDDSLVGGAGNDSLYGQDGNDTLEGGDGNDILDPGIGSDSVVGGSGSDRLVFDRSSETADVTIIYTDSNVDGTITGGVNDGTTFREIESVDELRLGSGNDNLNLSGTTADQQDIYSGEGNDTVVGGSSRDRIRGEDGDDSLVGGAGNDSLYGQDGNDTLEGGDGNDILDPGIGSDSVVGGSGIGLWIKNNC